MQFQKVQTRQHCIKKKKKRKKEKKKKKSLCFLHTSPVLHFTDDKFPSIRTLCCIHDSSVAMFLVRYLVRYIMNYLKKAVIRNIYTFKEIK